MYAKLQKVEYYLCSNYSLLQFLQNVYFFSLLEAQALSAKRDVSMSEKEKAWLSTIVSMKQIPPDFQHLVCAAEKLYGPKKIHSLSTKQSTQTTEIQEGKELFHKKAIKHIQCCIESCQNGISVLSTNMDKFTGKKCLLCVVYQSIYRFFYVDSSKQRAKLRKRISSEKATLKELALLLSKISSQSISIEDVENGRYFWQNEESESGG